MIVRLRNQGTDEGYLPYHKDGIRIPYKGDFKNNPHTLLLQQEMIREN